MKRILTHTALAALLVLSALSPAALAKTRHNKPSAEHVAAIRKCTEEYNAAMKDANTKKGKERAAAKTEARKARKSCDASAPK